MNNKWILNIEPTWFYTTQLRIQLFAMVRIESYTCENVHVAAFPSFFLCIKAILSLILFTVYTYIKFKLTYSFRGNRHNIICENFNGWKNKSLNNSVPILLFRYATLNIFHKETM